MNKVIARSLAAKFDETAIRDFVASSQCNFEFMFDRMLIAKGLLSVADVERIKLPDIFYFRMISVSLPETRPTPPHL